jgi:hypothetical protein
LGKAPTVANRRRRPTAPWSSSPRCWTAGLVVRGRRDGTSPPTRPARPFGFVGPARYRPATLLARDSVGESVAASRCTPGVPRSEATSLEHPNPRHLRGFLRCRRRDSNPRHADYDSVRLWLSHQGFGARWTRRWTQPHPRRAVTHVGRLLAAAGWGRVRRRVPSAPRSDLLRGGVGYTTEDVRNTRCTQARPRVEVGHPRRDAAGACLRFGRWAERYEPLARRAPGVASDLRARVSSVAGPRRSGSSTPLRSR